MEKQKNAVQGKNKVRLPVSSIFSALPSHPNASKAEPDNKSPKNSSSSNEEKKTILKKTKSKDESGTQEKGNKSSNGHGMKILQGMNAKSSGGSIL